MNVEIDEKIVLADYTVVSEWEQFTAQLEMLLGALSSKLAPEAKRVKSWTIPFKGASILVNLVDVSQARDKRLEGLGVQLSLIRGFDDMDLVRVGRLFGVTSFFMLRCDEDSLLTLPTARLLLSSLIVVINRHARAVSHCSIFDEIAAAFIIYGENNQIMGLSRDGLARYSSLVRPQDEMVSMTRANIWQEDSILRSLYRRYYHPRSLNQSPPPISLIYTMQQSNWWHWLAHQSDPHTLFGLSSIVNSNRSLLEKKRFRGNGGWRLILQTIFPRIESNLASLPRPWDAPIWIILRERQVDILAEGNATRLLRKLASLTEGLHQHHHLSSPDTEVESGLGLKPESETLHNHHSSSISEVVDCVFQGEAPSLMDRLLKAIFIILARKQANLVVQLKCFWKQFVMRCKYYFAELTPLPGHPATPDISHPLLEQKLAMLNYCIAEERHLRLIPHYNAKDSIDVPEKGRKEIHPHLYLLANPQEPLWIPYTQQPPPLTSDKLSLLPQDGGLSAVPLDDEGLNKRYAHLLSDMQAFKAANPNCQFADFIRWHSPRDWHQPSQPTDDGELFLEEAAGELSERMAERSSNLWFQLWQMAPNRALVQQQHPLLFDPSQEAAEIVCWLEDLQKTTLLETILYWALDFVTRRLGLDREVTLSDNLSLEARLEQLDEAEVQYVQLEYLSKLTSVSASSNDKENETENALQAMLISLDTEREIVAAMFSECEAMADCEMIVNSSRCNLYVRLCSSPGKLAEIALGEVQAINQ